MIRLCGARRRSRAAHGSRDRGLEDVKRYVTEDLGARPDRVAVIDAIISPAVRLRGARPFRDVPQLIMVARLETQKGHDTVLRALAQVPPPWELTIIGVGSLERELKELAERSGTPRACVLSARRTTCALPARRGFVFVSFALGRNGRNRARGQPRKCRRLLQTSRRSAPPSRRNLVFRPTRQTPGATPSAPFLATRAVT